MQDYIDKQWAKCLNDFSKKISSYGIDLWISALQPINTDEDRLVLVAPNDLCRQQINNHYLDRMREALREHFKARESLAAFAGRKR